MNEIKNNPEFDAKVKSFASLLEQQQKEQYRKNFNLIPEEVILKNCRVTVKYGKKYVRIDIGGSGKYMVDWGGNIYGIKGYGVINLRKIYGTLDTIHFY
jgi:hypothetical protein